MVQSFCGACPRRFASLSPREMQSISGPERFIESPGLGPRNLADFRGDLVPEITFVISRGAAKRSSGGRRGLLGIESKASPARFAAGWFATTGNDVVQ